ncbi:hypothetical protein P7K49_024550 [Saguinus oedipus]|uniref:Non-structural maintenance of chromosomes element 4 n=1 Tax=Saguinus oedipus TaxID=9490 RepID=A0ABQ9UQM3_SAGOE|nr:hypothetical protein P7K49_024550 [Saguinus oedipus]
MSGDSSGRGPEGRGRGRDPHRDRTRSRSRSPLSPGARRGAAPERREAPERPSLEDTEPSDSDDEMIDPASLEAEADQGLCRQIRHQYRALINSVQRKAAPRCGAGRAAVPSRRPHPAPGAVGRTQEADAGCRPRVARAETRREQALRRMPHLNLLTECSHSYVAGAAQPGRGARENREDILNAGDKLTEVLEEANTLFNEVSRAREAVLDAHFLVLASDLGKEKAKQLRSDLSSFDMLRYVETLISPERAYQIKQMKVELYDTMRKDGWISLSVEQTKTAMSAYSGALTHMGVNPLEAEELIRDEDSSDFEFIQERSEPLYQCFLLAPLLLAHETRFIIFEILVFVKQQAKKDMKAYFSLGWVQYLESSLRQSHELIVQEKFLQYERRGQCPPSFHQFS